MFLHFTPIQLVKCFIGMLCFLIVERNLYVKPQLQGQRIPSYPNSLSETADFSQKLGMPEDNGIAFESDGRLLFKKICKSRILYQGKNISQSWMGNKSPSWQTKTEVHYYQTCKTGNVIRWSQEEEYKAMNIHNNEYNRGTYRKVSPILITLKVTDCIKQK